ncbi:MAG: SDR family oxidoreductase [Salinivirgaceae bacterium]|jgi:3-oxoacyl-[acyl-carrier protein] reductase|nr:SDR family oxidoreductase [Salinivirgaceae bacterium]
MNIIITGASRGIGWELTKKLVEQGENQIFVISRNKQKLEHLAEECTKINSNAQVHAIGFDLGNIAEIKHIKEQIAKQVNLIDALINNAGYLENKPFEDMLPEVVEKIYKVNILAPIELTRCLLPMLKKAKSPHVVNISSMGGFQGSAKFPGLACYASSKAAIASLTECLAEEYKSTTIKFNCLALGAVATEMLAEAFPGYKAPTTDSDMAQYIADFTLNGHKMLNGKIIPVSKSTP